MIHIETQDAISLLSSIDDKSIAAIVTDIPYGVTTLGFDKDNRAGNNVALSAEFWEQVWRVTNVFITTAIHPLTAQLIVYQRDKFKHTYVWVKNNSTGWLGVNKHPLRIHEDVIVLAAAPLTYNPQKRSGYAPYIKNKNAQEMSKKTFDGYGNFVGKLVSSDGDRFPNTLLEFDTDVDLLKSKQATHPTQKPVALMEFLIRTYTNEGDVVCDPFCGSGTTAVACKQNDRGFIGGDIDTSYVAIALDRVAQLEIDYQPSSENEFTQLNMFAKDGD